MVLNPASIASRTSAWRSSISDRATRSRLEGNSRARCGVCNCGLELALRELALNLEVDERILECCAGHDSGPSLRSVTMVLTASRFTHGGQGPAFRACQAA